MLVFDDHAAKHPQQKYLLLFNGQECLFDIGIKVAGVSMHLTLLRMQFDKEQLLNVTQELIRRHNVDDELLG